MTKKAVCLISGGLDSYVAAFIAKKEGYSIYALSFFYGQRHKKELESANRAAANGNYSHIGELKRRLTWNHSGALLHDIYWSNLGGDGDPSKGPEIVSAIEKEFGSFEKWKEDFSVYDKSSFLAHTR